MDELILKAWDKNQKKVREWIANNRDFSYLSLLKNTIRILFEDTDDYYGYDVPSYERITKIDNGDYQGTLVFVIGGNNYQPSVEEHWYTSVGYGSCSFCDTLQSIDAYDCTEYSLNENQIDISSVLKEKQVDMYWTLCLHMMQKMKRME